MNIIKFKETGYCLWKSFISIAVFIVFLYPFSASLTLNAQTTSTKGRDFWVMFMYNHNYNSGSHTEEQRIYILGDQPTTVNITNNNSSNITATLASPSYSAMKICGSNQLQNATVFNGGYHVTTSEDVWVYADNYIDNNQDVALILPTEALGTYYIVQDYPSTNDRGAEVGFLATQDNTVITMTVPCNVLNTSINTGTTLNITLNSGQTYMLMASPNGSFSGMEVSSNGKPFAMFVAGQNTAVPTSGSGRDFTYEQAVPVDQWGTEFIVSSTTCQSTHRLRITSSADSCMVYESGSLIAGPLNKGGTWEGIISTSTQWHITSTSPVQVILYLGSYQTAGNIGDPSSITIPPINKGINDYYFRNISSPEISSQSHYVNIICHQDYDAGLVLDSGSLPSNETVAILGDYRCHSVPLPLTYSNGGRHRLQNSLGPFIAYAYGVGNWESYGFTLGFSLDSMETEDIYDTLCQGQSYDSLGLSLQGIHTQNAGNLMYERTYMGVHYVFHLTVVPSTSSDVYDSIALGDTMLWNGIEVTAAGEYTVTLTGANGCDSVVTLHIMYIGSTEHLYDTICVGTLYSGYGFATANPVMNDTVLTRDTVENEVPKRYVLHLNVLPTSLTQLNYTIIMGDTIGVCDTLLSVAGNYTFHYTNVHGCDSTVEVHLAYEAISLRASKDGICPGEEVTLTATGVHTYIWSSSPYDSELDAQQGMNPVTVHPMQTTVYSLLDEVGNIVATVTIGTDAAPTLCVEVNRDILDFDNPTLLFTDCSAGRYTTRWLFADGRQFTGERVRRRFNYPLPDSAIVTMTSCNRYNCCADTTIAIPMKINSVWFPNAFMPGADDNNLFQCFTSMDVAIFELVVYNRWGLLIWSSEDVNQGWDGRRTDGTPCPQGAYAYRYYLKATDGTVRTGTGTVTLLR